MRSPRGIKSKTYFKKLLFRNASTVQSKSATSQFLDSKKNNNAQRLFRQQSEKCLTKTHTLPQLALLPLLTQE